MTPIIKITDGITRHPDWRMAEPVNMEILPGEQVAICGDNASGKSRLVEILTGHYPLLRNEVFYNFDNSGTEAGTPTHKRLISEQLRFISFRDSYGEQDGTYYYQQRWNQHDIDENTPTVGSLLDKIPEYQPGLRQRLYKMFALEPVLDKYIISLSSGELRKFQLIRTLLHSPRVLIMDNPFIGLDASTRDLLQGLLETLTKDTDLTVILVLSKYDDIPTFVTHVIPVKEMKVMPKQTRLQFLQNAAYDALYTLPQDQVAAIRNLPHKDITSIPFYPQNGGEILRLCNVSVRYGNRTILNDVNWIIHEGEKWALQGQNGSGKSTLLSLVCADNPQSYACDINIFGHRRGSGESIWQIKQHIGYVSPEMHRAYMRDLPAIDIVASGLSDSVGLYFHPRPEQLDTCQSWMAIFGISHIQDKTFLKLSSGEQRLCLLARAFVKDPELLILDEPLHGLDINNKQRVRDIIQLFCQRPHKTLIMVTHYTDELPDCITHNLILKRNL